MYLFLSKTQLRRHCSLRVSPQVKNDLIMHFPFLVSNNHIYSTYIYIEAKRQTNKKSSFVND